MLARSKSLAAANACLLSLLVAASSSVVAAAGAATDNSQGPEAPSADQLQTIVVTAQRRLENLQDVPIAISAIDESALKNYGAATTADLPALVPGLEILQIGGAFNPILRGIGSENGAVGDESNVALYIDGVYIASHQGGLVNLNNIDRIEVLEGPQGTLFGRNAAGGVIQIITRTPDQSPRAELSVGYGNYNTVNASGYLSSGITSNLAADIAFNYQNQMDGYGTNFGDGGALFTNLSEGVRTKWVLNLDGTDVTFAADWDRERSQNNQDRLLAGASSGFTGLTYDYGFYNADLSFNPVLDTKQGGASIRLEHDFAWARGISITSYRVVQQNDEIDGDALAINAQTIGFSTRENTLTEEMQLQSLDGSPVKWVMGAFLMSDRAAYPLVTILQPPVQVGSQSVQNTFTYAEFAQATKEVAAATNLTLGVRYTDDHRRVYGGEELGIKGFVPYGPVYEVGGHATFQDPTWRVALDHRFSDELLGYVSYNRGFKSGVYELLPLGDPPQPVKPETIDAYEIGAKSDLLDKRLRLNFDVFYSRVDNLQLEVPEGTSIILQNAAKAEIEGVEMQLEAAPVDSLLVNAGVSALHSYFSSFKGAAAYFPCPNPVPATGPASSCTLPGAGNYGPPANAASLPQYDATGHPLDLTPSLSGTASAQYTIHAHPGDFALGTTYSYNSGFYWGPDDRLRQPTTSLVGAYIDWMDSSRTWEVRFWGKNLTGAHYYLLEDDRGSGDYATPAAPRTYGITFTAHLGHSRSSGAI